MSYQDLIKQLEQLGTLNTPRIISVFKKVDRADFMLPEDRKFAGADTAFSIGSGQTISQPTTVAFMLEKLQPQKGDKVLDIGSGSSWTTALLAKIVGPEGKVWGIEINPAIYKFGQNNLQKLNLPNIELKLADASGGWPAKAPFDRILAGAASGKISQVLKKQLKIGGRLVVPVQDTIISLERKSQSKFCRQIFPFFAFVPMRGKYGQK